jgi:hypothetical protein
LKEDGVYQEEKGFRLRFSLEARFPDTYEGDEDEYAWLQEWERSLKPELLTTVFSFLRRHPSWTVHIRNRGASPEDEIEIALLREFS